MFVCRLISLTFRLIQKSFDYILYFKLTPFSVSFSFSFGFAREIFTQVPKGSQRRSDCLPSINICGDSFRERTAAERLDHSEREKDQVLNCGLNVFVV